MEACLLLASSLLAVASIAIDVAANLAADDSSSRSARLLKGAAGGLLIAGIVTVCLHLFRYLFWYGRSRLRRRHQPDLGELPTRVPLLMSTDWDFALALGIIVAAALSE